MKEYDCNRIDEYNRKNKEYLTDKKGDYKFNKCKKTWVSTTDDINKETMITYYKCYGVCRLYLYNKSIEYRNKKK